jgi:hypothetical protein
MCNERRVSFANFGRQEITKDRDIDRKMIGRVLI